MMMLLSSKQLRSSCVSPVSFADVSSRRGQRRSASTVHELDKKLTTRASANEEWKSQSRNLRLDDDYSLSPDEYQNDSLVSHFTKKSWEQSNGRDAHLFL